jgi:hypothetical protein
MTLLGSIIFLGTTTRAILLHLTKLVIVVNKEGGVLFTTIIIVFVSCPILIIPKKDKIPALFKFKI